MSEINSTEKFLLMVFATAVGSVAILALLFHFFG